MPVINSYLALQQFIQGILDANGDSPVGPPHQQFWDAMTYDQFTNGNVPNVVDPTTNLPMKILVKGNSKASNLILALQGAKGTIFDPNNPNPKRFGRMPKGGTPFTDPQIQAIADWIDANCPQ